uniref:Peptidase_M13_N domain-containing protein n=1 Tax=Panagrellus redivivus TaxID=6233 RepID=A0A7E4V875_PANRE
MVNLTLWFTVFIGVCSQCAAAPSDSATSASKKILAEIGDMINTKVDPCNNFHDYVCSKQNVSVLYEIHEMVQERIANLINRVPKSTDGAAVKKYYEFYEFCKKTKKVMDNYNPKYHFKYVHFYEVLDNVIHYYFAYIQLKIDYLVNPRTMAKMEAYLQARHGFNLVTQITVLNPIKKAEFISKYSQLYRIEMPTLSKSMLYYDPKFRHKTDGIVKTSLFNAINGTVAPFLSAYTDRIEDTAYTIDFLTKIEYQIADVIRSNNVEEIEEMTVKEAMEKMPEFDWKAFILTLESHSKANITKNRNVEDIPLQFESVNATAQTLKILSNLTSKDYLTYFLTRTYMQAETDGTLLLDTNATIDCNVLTQRTFPLVKQHLYITETYSTAERERQIK